MGPSGHIGCILHILDCLGQDMQVLYLGRAPRTKETLPDFLKGHRVTRRPLVFRGLTGSQRTPGFWGVTNTVKPNGVRLEVIKLQLFPFSLRDVVTTWFESLLYGLVNNWEELVEAYMSRFFPPAITSERRGEIIVFKQ